MIYLVTGRPEEYDWKALKFKNVKPGNFDEFLFWSYYNDQYQLDTETTMTKDGPNAHQERKLLVLQFSDLLGTDRWVVDWTGLSPEWKRALSKFLGNKKNTFYLHNSAFDYSVIFANANVKLYNIHDTYLMSRVLNTGLTLHKGYHSLAECLARFLQIHITKDQQTTFTEEPMTIEQVVYAADDVLHLGDLFKELKKLLDSWDLWDVYDKVEREVVKVYCDMEFNPMNFDVEHWKKLAKEFIEEKNEILDNLNRLILTTDDSLVRKLKNPNNDIGQALIQPVDEYMINWNSSSQRTILLNLLIPGMPDIKRKPEIKKWFKENEDTLTEDEIEVLTYYMARKYDDLNNILISKHQRWLQQNGLFKAEGDVMVNWNSTVHKLFIFNHFYPNLADTNAKSLARIHKNPIINEFKKYTKAQKNVSSYGENFITKYLRADGMIAPFGFNQLLTTGRVSFGILLQIPGKAKFRNAFLPPKDDWVFVDTDYSSAEVAIMSYAAGETAFLDAIKAGKDLHCMSASLIFADKWKDVAEPGCQHLIDGSRCNCVEHENLRKFSKAITFGLAYGLTYHGLADRLDISKTESKELIEKFFGTFTKLKGFFETNRDLGIKNQYIRGLAPTKRIRFFAYPEHSDEEEAIGREAKNFVIQEANASILKIALVNLRKRIIKENLPVILHLPIHDEILASCPRGFADTYLKIQEEEMMNAANAFLEEGLLGVDSEILEIWTK